MSRNRLIEKRTKEKIKNRTWKTEKLQNFHFQ